MNENNIPQSGFIPCDPKPEDYMVGGVTGVAESAVRMVSGDWSAYEPVFTPQFAPGFDTLSCTAFSAISTLEMQLNYLYKHNFLSKNALDFLKKNNYINPVYDKIRFSRRFTAIMSHTTKDGNTFPAVWDSARLDGLIPDVMFPFGGTTFEEYHNPINISPAQVVLAKQFLSYFDIKYEWIIINTGDGMVDTPAEKVSVKEAKQMAPLQMAIPNPSHHATTLVSDTVIFDTYPPYIFDFSDKYPVQYIMRGFIYEKVPTITYSFAKALSLGSISNDVLMLQKFLNSTDTPIGNYGKETTYFGTATQKALANFQKKWGILPAIGYFGPTTMAKVNSFCMKPITSKIDLFCQAIQRHEGYYSGSRSYVNNNPANFRWTQFVQDTLGATGKDAKSFATFPTYNAGYNALKKFVTMACTNQLRDYKSTMSIQDYFNVYAPSSDGNDTIAYAKAVASAIGSIPDTPISFLI